ncbi:MAG TPA: autotransporter assembly complex family protein [Vineibacter sp.]|nr:autotransporter assembly complex family protein [Vineibacter sp.]
MACLTLVAVTSPAQPPAAPPQAPPTAAPPQRTGKPVVTLRVSGDMAVQEELQKVVEVDAKSQDQGGSAATILQRAQAQRDLVVKVLRAQGYYSYRVTARAAGQGIDEASAIDAIDALPRAADVPVDVTVETGPRFTVRNIDIVLQGPPGPAIARDKLPLAVGQPAAAAKILASDEEILGQLQRQGYALARIASRDVTIDHDTRAARVIWRVDPGPQARMGPVTFRGAERTDAGFLARRVPYKPGEPYHPDRIEELRTRLTELGIFNSIRIVRGSGLDAQGGLPVEVEVIERMPRTIGFAASYATSEGVGLRAYWQHRNLSGEADSLRLSAEATGLVERKLVDTGFAVTALYRKPDFLRSDQTLTAQAGVLREINDAYRRRSILASGGVERLVAKGFVIRAGLGAEAEIVETAERRDNYLLLSVPVGMTLDRSDNVLDPTKGFRLALDAIPYTNLRAAGEPFVKLRATGSVYFDLSDSGATVVALRASVGIMPGATKNAVPPDKRFFAGGGGSVRGFDYQSAGPRDRDHRPLGGQSIVEGSVELRQRLTEKFGAVAFVDAGTAYTSPFPGKGDAPRIGAGVGVRYYSDFGPIRADVAMPLNRRPGDSWFGLYVSIGQAF